MPNVGWTRLCDLAAPCLQEHRQASGPLCPGPGAVGRSSGALGAPAPPHSRCAHPCSCRQLNLWEEGTHLAPLRGNYNLLPTSSSDRLRLVCPLALWHLFTTSRASHTQQLTRTLGSAMDRLWEVTGKQRTCGQSCTSLRDFRGGFCGRSHRDEVLVPHRRVSGPSACSRVVWSRQPSRTRCPALRPRLFLTVLSFSSGLLCS